ncbi:MAG: 2-keto-3-deoxygluconate permease [Sphaerochaeta sp.]|uniref:2-keto-3-deoxygluconate permease n=1 Tax=Sphaerochaeta sp. TaxID=1972642 RepID=UPI003D0B4AA5
MKYFCRQYTLLWYCKKIALLCFYSVAQINSKTAGMSLYRGLVINTRKVFSGLDIGVFFACVAGPETAFRRLYTALASKYGDESEVGAIAVISSHDGPFFEMMCMGVAGVADIPLMALVDPAWEPFEDKATVQVAASIIVTAILVPFLVDFFCRRDLKHGEVNEHPTTSSVAVDAKGQQL